MAYAPGIQPIGGQLIGQGLAQGLGGLAQGIMQRAQKRQEKEQLGKAVESLQPLVDQLAPGVKLDKDLPKEAIPQVIQLADHLNRQQKEAPLRAIQLENEQLRKRLSQQELDRAAADAAALRDAGAAFAGGAPETALPAYLNKGGSDPRVLAQLGELAMGAGQPAGKQAPQEITLPGGERVAFSPSTGAFSVLPSAPIPSGYERASQGLRPVPGGPVDMEQQRLAQTKEEGRRQLVVSADNVIDTIDNALPMVDELTAGLGGTVLNKIPGTKAKNLSRLIDTIQSNVGFDRLQKMREASPTGGALGSMAVTELKALQSSIASLDTDQTPAQLRKNLDRVRTHYSRWRSVAQGINPDEAPAGAAPSGAAPAAPAAPAMSADDLLKKWTNPK